MGFLNGKKILLTGLLSKRSIAYGIAKSIYREGAKLAFTYSHDRFKNRIATIAQEFCSEILLPCDVTNDIQINNVFKELIKIWPVFDGFIHSIAFAPRLAIAGNFLEGINRENFHITHDISAYSFIALAKAAYANLSSTGSLLTLTYIGSTQVVPNYNTMGLAKASLEASIRYLAVALGGFRIRVNGISAGPIKTLASSGIKDFSKILEIVEKSAPIHRNITITEIGNVSAFLMSDLASGITGEIIHVDNGFNITIGNLQ